MKQIFILETNDEIEATDWVRQLEVEWGHSDSLQTNSTYGGTPINRMGWIPVKWIMPYWVGSTVGDYLDAVKLKYEFARGDLPQSHLEELTDKETKLLEQTEKMFQGRKTRAEEIIEEILM